MKKNEGITLVALIITIIVMLILVGVSVSVLINSDLIDTAQNAGDRTETAYGEEGNLGAIKVGDKSYASIQDYLDGNIMPEWVTIYEGNTPITVTGGQILLSNTSLFMDGYKYRITVESEEYTGSVETVAIKFYENNGTAQFALFGVENGQTFTCSTVEEVLQKMNSGTGTFVGGANVTGVGSMVATQGATCDYTITKIERKGSSHNWKYTDNTMAKIKCTCVECREVNKEGVTLSIGQDVANYIAGPEGTEWIVFGTEDQDANGIYENVLITTTELSGEKIEIGGKEGYNTGISQIEAKVDELYGTEARGMTIEDVNRTLGYTPTGGIYHDTTIGLTAYFKYYNGFDTTYEEHLLQYVTKKYKEENSIEGELTQEQQSQVEAEVANILSTKIGPEEGKNVGSYNINGYWYCVDSTTISEFPIVNGIKLVPTTTSNIPKSIVFGSSNENAYWLASRGVIGSDEGVVGFGTYAIRSGLAVCVNTWTSAGVSSSEAGEVRPVVSLGANLLSVVGITTE